MLQTFFLCESATEPLTHLSILILHQSRLPLININYCLQSIFILDRKKVYAADLADEMNCLYG